MEITITTKDTAKSKKVKELLAYLDENGLTYETTNKDILKIGDTVNWRGCFGSDPKKPAVIEHIEITGGGKYGTPVKQVSWEEVYDRNLVVTLENGHWAYAEQISKP